MMSVLNRKEGQWVEITHRSGDVIRFQAYGIEADAGGARVNLAFDDTRDFSVSRPERLSVVGRPNPVEAPTDD